MILYKKIALCLVYFLFFFISIHSSKIDSTLLLDGSLCDQMFSSTYGDIILNVFSDPTLHTIDADEYVLMLDGFKEHYHSDSDDLDIEKYENNLDTKGILKLVDSNMRRFKKRQHTVKSKRREKKNDATSKSLSSLLYSNKICFNENIINFIPFTESRKSKSKSEYFERDRMACNQDGALKCSFVEQIAQAAIRSQEKNQGNKEKVQKVLNESEFRDNNLLPRVIQADYHQSGVSTISLNRLCPDPRHGIEYLSYFLANAVVLSRRHPYIVSKYFRIIYPGIRFVLVPDAIPLGDQNHYLGVVRKGDIAGTSLGNSPVIFYIDPNDEDVIKSHDQLIRKDIKKVLTSKTKKHSLSDDKPKNSLLSTFYGIVIKDDDDCGLMSGQFAFALLPLLGPCPCSNQNKPFLPTNRKMYLRCKSIDYTLYDLFHFYQVNGHQMNRLNIHKDRDQFIAHTKPAIYALRQLYLKHHRIQVFLDFFLGHHPGLSDIIRCDREEWDVVRCKSLKRSTPSDDAFEDLVIKRQMWILRTAPTVDEIDYCNVPTSHVFDYYFQLPEWVLDMGKDITIKKSLWAKIEPYVIMSTHLHYYVAFHEPVSVVAVTHTNEDEEKPFTDWLNLTILLDRFLLRVNSKEANLLEEKDDDDEALMLVTYGARVIIGTVLGVKPSNGSIIRYKRQEDGMLFFHKSSKPMAVIHQLPTTII